MDQEVLFAKTLEFVKRTAKEQGGIIGREQLDTAFAPCNLKAEQMAMVEDYLAKHAIGVEKNVDPEEYLSREEIDTLEEYTESLKSLPQYTEGQKEAAFLAAMAGEADARETLIQIFLPQVPELARLYSGQGVLVEDLIGQANMALSEGVTMLNAMENAAEAESMLVKMMMDSMEELVGVTFSSRDGDEKITEKINEVADKARALAESLRRSVTPTELSEETGMPLEVILEADRLSGYAIEDLEHGNSKDKENG